MKRNIDLTHVWAGTYDRIAEQLHVSRSLVEKVARGQRSNIHVEIALLEAVRERKRIEERAARLRKHIRQIKKMS